MNKDTILMQATFLRSAMNKYFKIVKEYEEIGEYDEYYEEQLEIAIERLMIESDKLNKLKG